MALERAHPGMKCSPALFSWWSYESHLLLALSGVNKGDIHEGGGMQRIFDPAR